MDLSLSEEQVMLRDAVRSMCERHSTVEKVRSLEGDSSGYNPELWKSLKEMDLLDLLLDQWLPIEVSVVCEELGRALAPSPYVETAVFGAVLQGKVAGVTTLAWHEPERTEGPEGIEATFDGSSVSGTKILVPFASSTDSMLVLARSADDVVVVSVDPKGPGVAISQEGTLASDARFEVALDGAPASLVASGWDEFMRAATPSLVAVASYAVGAADRAHEISVEYAKERVQFDRPIGSFQAMAHPLSDLRAEIDGARTLVHQAAWALAEKSETAQSLAAMAKYYACDVFRRTAKFGHQVFGGIGFTLDIDIQLFMRRAKQLEMTWFTPRYLEEVIAGAELDTEQPLVSTDAVASAAAES
jgi:alkylation response protein AidB-like acyl-CoA dehydrogenase